MQVGLGPGHIVLDGGPAGIRLVAHTVACMERICLACRPPLSATLQSSDTVCLNVVYVAGSRADAEATEWHKLETSHMFGQLMVGLRGRVICLQL